MIDVRPVGYLMGWLVTALGASMALPMAADLLTGDSNAQVFATTAIVTVVVGVLMALACSRRDRRPLGRQQGFLLTTGIWVVFPLFGALPFWLGAPLASYTDAMFEAMSAITTTGSTVFVGLDALPAGTLLWRGMLQWFGGLGIVVVAMIFLPALKVGGMQLFRSEAFDTLGKILPRAGGIAFRLTAIYLVLSLLCFLGYALSGMAGFDAAVHAMTTVSTGGMANTDASFIAYSPAAHYVAIVFMVLAALPFVRFVQLASGSARPLMRDSQVRTFLLVIAAAVGVMSAWLLLVQRLPAEPTLREALFNIVSVITGTGFTSTDYNAWGPLAMTLFFIIGLIGGCSGSTVCSVKIFRYQLLFSAISAQVKHLHSPSRVFTPRYEGRPVPPDVMDSVIAFFMLFYLTLAVSALLLVMIGLEPVTAITGAATALANIGPGLGPESGPVGSVAGLPAAAKWVLTATMLLGRLEIMSVLVIFSLAFWRD
jgi:trk system potassium uptake protein TrkH